MADHKLQINPNSELVFFLSDNVAKPVIFMTLKHGEGSNKYIAFKIRTKHPPRFAVRESQGLIAPGTSQTIRIMIREKEKQVLLQQIRSQKDCSDDLFRVNFWTVDSAFVAQNSGSETELYDSITSMWDSMDTKTTEKKDLCVRHVLDEEEVIYSQEGKLFVYGETLLDVGTGKKAWKERGIGDIRILKQKHIQRMRVVMFQENTMKVILNHCLNPQITLQALSDRSFGWSALDFADGELKKTVFKIHFLQTDIANNFKKAFEDHSPKNEGNDENKPTSNPHKGSLDHNKPPSTHQNGSLNHKNLHSTAPRQNPRRAKRVEQQEDDDLSPDEGNDENQPPSTPHNGFKTPKPSARKQQIQSAIKENFSSAIKKKEETSKSLNKLANSQIKQGEALAKNADETAKTRDAIRQHDKEEQQLLREQREFFQQEAEEEDGVRRALF